MQMPAFFVAGGTSNSLADPSSPGTGELRAVELAAGPVWGKTDMKKVRANRLPYMTRRALLLPATGELALY